MKRFLLLLSLLLGLSLPAMAQEDDEGTRLERLIENALSGDGMDVTVRGFRGALSSQATMERLTIADDQGIWLTLENAELDWSRLALLRGRLQVDELSAERLDLARLPASGSAAPAPEASGGSFALPDLPVSVNVGRFAIDAVELGAPVIGEEVTLNVEGTAQLADGEGNVELAVVRQNGPTDALNFTGSYANDSRELLVDLVLEEGSGGLLTTKMGLPGAPPIRLAVQGEGVVDDFTADLTLATDGEDRFAGQVTLEGVEEQGHRFAADLEGDLRPLLPEEQRAFLGDNQLLRTSGILETGGAIELDELTLETAAMSLDGEARIGAEGWPERLRLSGRIASEDGSPVRLAFAQDETLLEQATLSLFFDASVGDEFTLELALQGLDRPEMSLQSAQLSGAGVIAKNETSSLPGAVRGQLNLDVTGLAFSDASLAEATGDAMTGALQFDWQQGSPLEITGIDLTGAGIGVQGDVVLSGLTEGADPAIEPDLQIRAENLARFSGLAGRTLGGDADVRVSGRAEPVSGRFDITVAGNATDLAAGIPQVDGLLAGNLTLDATAARTEQGTFLRNLDLDGPGIVVTADAQLQTGASTGQFDLTLPDLSLVDPAMSGAATLTGTLDEGEDAYALDLVASGPGNTQFDGVVTAGKGEDGGVVSVGFTGDASAADLSAFAAIADRPLDGAASFQGTGSYTLENGYFDADGSLQTRDVEIGIDPVDGLLQGTTDAEVNVTRDADGITIRRAEVDGPGLEMTATGTLLDAGSSASFDITLPDLTRLRAEGLAGRATLRGTLEESAEAYLLNLAATGPAQTQIDGNVTATKAEDGGIADVSFDGTAAGGDLSAFADLAGRELDGSFSFDGEGAYALESGYFDADGTLETNDLAIGIQQVDGLLRGTTRTEIDVSRDAEGITIRRADVDGPGIQLTANGNLVGDGSTATFNLTLPDLSPVAPGMSGSVSVSGDLQESAEAYRLDFTARGPGQTLAGGIVTASKTDEGQIGTVGFDGTASVGSLAAYAPLTGQTLRGSVSFDGAGSYTLATGAFSADGTLNTRDLATGIEIADRLAGGSGSAVVSARRDDDGNITVEELDVTTSQITATMNGTLSQSGDSALSYDVALNNLGVIVPQLPGRATASGTLGGSGSGPWQVDTRISAPGGTQATVSGTLAQSFDSANLSIAGNAPLALANQIAEPNLLSGMAQLNLRLNGPLAPSSLAGTVTVNGAEVVLPGPGLSLNGININANLGGGQVRLDVTGQLATGGRLETSGTIGLNAPYGADLTVQMRELLLEDRRLYQATAGGRVTVQGPLLTGPTIGGRIDIEQAELRIPETGLGPGSRGFTLTHLSEPAPVRQTRARAGLIETGSSRGGPAYTLPLDLEIRAPSRIFVRGRGLDAELGGSLRITGTSQDIVPVGRFDLIRGRLDILGQRLTLDTAILRLTGDFVPTIEVEATAERDGTVVTVSIEGEATEPEVTFSSNPSRPEEEVLALLLFGRDVTELSALQALRIAAAVNTLAGQGGEGIVGNLRRGFGLDDFDVTTDDEGNAGLRLGKYISDDLYTDVEVDSGGETSINLNYQINRNVKARASADTGGDSGLGIYFEKDY
ncbi:translocation/assembly module TamB domain-containing protein [Salipiger bermudensis]|uniref:translocation/assembly module TamB domain-containing protein n=1 Tax=Salipiger bermudensis TaxID=344736 RepID=UPI001F5C67EE|nr:translocation/assembly module TamB domain-containing protein [Salipiger bermudensis]